MNGKTLEELARVTGGKIVGDPKLMIRGINGIKEAVAGEISFLANPRYRNLLATSNASAVIVPEGITSERSALIVCQNPSLAFSKVAELFGAPEKPFQPGVHPSVVISQEARLGANVAIGPGCVIEDGAEIGANSHLVANTFIGADCRVGEHCVIYPNVTLREKTVLGNRVIVHSGTVLGADGFGYINIEGRHVKIPQTGRVVIEDDVEIGANVTIDRARFGETRVCRGAKIDNLVMIAHNCRVGENCIVVAQSGISGSTKVGHGAIIAAQVGVAGHIEIGDGAVLAGRAGVTKSVPAGTMVSGFPAQPHDKELREEAARRKLPELLRRMKELEKKVVELEQKTNNHRT